MSGNKGKFEYLCGCVEIVKLNGCAGWRHEQHDRRAAVENQKVCADCRKILNKSASLRDPAALRVVFRMAWESARRGAAQFGGKAKQYFGEALRQAYAYAKKSIIAPDSVGILVEILRKTDRAIYVRHEDGNELWWPLSQIKLNGNRISAPDWLRMEKLKEMKKRSWQDEMLSGNW